MSGELLPDSALVGSVLRAEADGGLDGLEITSVFAPKARSQSADRLELIDGRAGPLVTTTLVSKRRRRDDDRDDAGPRRGDRKPRRDQRDDRDRKPRRRDGDRDDTRDRPKRGERDGDERGRGRRDDRPRDDRPAQGRDRGAPDERRRSNDRNRSGPPGGDRRPRRDSAPGSRDGRKTKRGDQRSSDRRPPPPRPKMPALKAKQIHRKAALEAVPADQQTLARQVLRGGVPGVRKAIERMNGMAAAENLPQIRSEPLIALAETLAPVLKAAEWHDRADAALAGIATIDLRDIRSVIAAADRATRSDETRALAVSLRSGLATRLEVDQRKWLDELATTIHEGRTVRALRLSSHPPKAGTPLPPDMAERLANMAAADLNPDANQQRWATVVDSIARSPVRTQVIPVGAPEKPSEELLVAIRKLADRVPQIAALFGVEPKPPRRSRGRPPPPPPPAAQAGASASDVAPPSTVAQPEIAAAVKDAPAPPEVPTEEAAAADPGTDDEKETVS